MSANANAQIVISMRNQADPEVRKLASSFRDLIQKLRDAGATQEQAERKALSHAQALAQLASKSGQAATAERTLAAALSQVNRESTAAVRTASQLASVQNRMAQEATRAAAAQRRSMDTLRSALQPVAPAANQARASFSGLAGAMGEIKMLAGGLGIGLGVQQLISGGIAAGQEALALRETKNSLKAVSGDARTYAQVLAIARQQQVLFGGSLRENIEGLSGLTITARESGAQLQTLIDLSQRLAIKDPSQGAQGARIALAEALSGDPTSLAKRYEIPRAALAKLRDESATTAEKLAVIDDYLNKVGITSAAVAGRVDQDALAYRRLGQELGDLKTAVGDGLATSFSGAATGLSRLIGLVNENPQAIAELKALLSGKGSISQQDVDQAGQDAARQRATRQLVPTAAPYAKAATSQRLGGEENFQAVVQQLTALELAGEGSAQAARQLTQQWQSNIITADEYRQQLAALAQASTQTTAGSLQAAGASIYQSQAMIDASKATQEQNAALIEQAQKTIAAKVETEKLAQFQATLARLGSAVAGGHLTAANAAIELGNQYGWARSKALELIIAQSELAGLQSRTTAADGVAQHTARLEAQGEAYKKIREANEQRINQTGTAAEKEALYLKQLQRARDTYGKGSVEAIDAETKLIAFRQQQEAQAERAADRAGKAKIKDAREVLNLTERTADSQEKQLRAALDARLGALDDRKQRRIEGRELAAVQRLLASGRGSADQRAAAEDVLQRIPLEQQRRALDIASKSRDAGGAIIGGKLYGSQSGGSLPALPGAPAGSFPAIPSLPGASAPATGIPIVEVLVSLDGQQIAANVVTRMRGGFHGARAGGSGGG